MLNPWTLLAAQILAHASFVYLILNGSLFHWIVALCVYFFNGCIGMTMTYHRLLSHKSWNAVRFVEIFGALCATIGLTGSAISWVAIHRKHHRHTDTAKDPHSPWFKGFIYCQWFSMFEPVELKYVTDLAKNRFYIFQHKYYFLINLTYAGGVFLLDPFAVVYAWLVPACILWNAGSSIVTFSHLYGERPHSISSRAGNHWILGLLVWGEGWHNNHHSSPTSPYFGQKWWQVDIGGWLIRIFQLKK